ncbi:MAG: DUF3500 domain-containing protein, partial [Planctomycetota bacterium]
MRIVPATLAVCCLLIVGLKDQDPPGKRVAMYADVFLSQLDDEQKAIAVMDYDSDKRVDWHFIPKDERKGLQLADMTLPQRVAGLRTLRSALSEAGYEKASKIMLMEGVLRALEGDDRRWARDPHKY